MSDTNPSQEQNALHRKYRPQTLDKIIGHTEAVTRLQGTIKTGKIPSAVLFTGASSAGKTTLARAYAAALNGKPVTQQQDFKELNAADQRGIDDVRELIKISKFKPINKRRVFVIDEAQQLVTNKAAVQAFLKPLEEPSPGTLWILCSMDPAKFMTGDGKAVANRCVQIALAPHSDSDLLKQAVRIAKGEAMTYIMDEEKKLVGRIVENSNGEMRTLANLMESVQQYYAGLDPQPKKLKLTDIGSVLSSTESADDDLAVKVMLGLYSGKYTMVCRALLDIQDGFMFIKKLMYLSEFMLNVSVLGNERHRKVWWSASNRKLHEAAKKLQLTLGMHAAINARFVRIAAQAASFQVSAEQLLASELYYLVKEVHTPKKE